MSWWDSTGAKISQGDSGNQSQAPQAGQFANNQQGFLDWATAKYGADPTRGQGFVNAQAGGGLQNLLKEYGTATGNTANFKGGPSGDRVDFGQGDQDALTSGGQIWNPNGGSGGGGGQSGAGGGAQGGYGGGGGGYGGGGAVSLPGAPQYQGLKAPDPFTYQKSTLGQFAGAGDVPDAPNLTYRNVDTPDPLRATQYSGLTADQLKADPSYNFRRQSELDAVQGSAASKGVLRTGNTAKALQDRAADVASTEYAAADQRARSTVQQNNAADLAFSGQNFDQSLAATNANNQNAYNFGNVNFRNALDSQGQRYGQAANTYGINQGAQNQDFTQALAAHAQNANTGLAYGSQNQNAELANYQAQVNAALGLGNLNLGFQNSNNNFALGNRGYDLQGQNQNFNQGLATYDRNYQSTVTDPWNQNLQLAQLGNYGSPNGQANANAQSDLLTGQGNANAAGQVGSANAWRNGATGLANLAQGAYGYWNANQPQRQTSTYKPGQGMPPYAQ